MGKTILNLKFKSYTPAIDDQSPNNQTKCRDCNTIMPGARTSCKEDGSRKLIIKHKK